MLRLMHWIATRFMCLITRRHQTINERAIFGRIMVDGQRQGLHICPHCGSYVWLPDYDDEMIPLMH